MATGYGGGKMQPSDPFRVVADFEKALCDYTGAPYAVAVSSCTSALFLSLSWWYQKYGPQVVEIPAKTYVSVPMVAIRAGHCVRFVDHDWPKGWYRIPMTTVYDAAPTFYPGMYHLEKGKIPTGYVCVSFHPKKPLGLANGGGAILHDDPEADEWFRRMRHDGRTDGAGLAQDNVSEIGYHCPMFPSTAAEGLQKLSVYKPQPVVLDDYRDCRTFPVFQNNPMVVT